MAECLSYRLFGDLMKHHAPCWHFIQLGSLNQVPGNGLSFTVGVGGQIENRCILSGCFYLAYDLALTLRNDVFRDESVAGVHAELLLRKVTDVPHGCHDNVPILQDATYGPCLCR